LVEDDAAVRSLTERILIGAGYRVLTADAAEVAIVRALIHEGDIDLILSDVVMPGSPITDAVAQIREDRPSIAVLLMSGYPDLEVRRRVQSNDIDLIAKPFTAPQLLERVRSALARRGQRVGKPALVVA
jgi:DNA-binding NtrC family response regulator